MMAELRLILRRTHHLLSLPHQLIMGEFSLQKPDALSGGYN